MRDHNMFGFLTSDVPSSKIDLDLLQEFANEAASAYLGNSQIPLNHTIQKIAKSEELTPDHISIVCQEANKKVHGQLFKTASDKYITFDLADPSAIVSVLEESLSKVASAETSMDGLDDYNLAPSEKRASMQGDFQMVGSHGHNGLAYPKAHVQKVAMEKKASRLKDIEGDLIILDAQIESAETEIVKMARNQILPYRLEERPSQFLPVAKFCKSAGLNVDHTEKLMGLTALVMKKQGLLEKSADIKVGPELISENLNLDVRNGNHPLEILIKTLVSKESRRQALRNEFNLIKTELADWNANGAIMGQHVREL